MGPSTALPCALHVPVLAEYVPYDSLCEKHVMAHFDKLLNV